MLNKPRVMNGGRPPYRTYLRLREYHDRISRLFLDNSTSGNQAATMLDIPASSLVQLRDLITHFQVELAQKNFEAIENALFGPFGNYKLLKGYKKYVLNQVPKSDVTPKKKRGPKPGFKRKSKGGGVGDGLAQTKIEPTSQTGDLAHPVPQAPAPAFIPDASAAKPIPQIIVATVSAFVKEERL